MDRVRYSRFLLEHLFRGAAAAQDQDICRVHRHCGSDTRDKQHHPTHSVKSCTGPNREDVRRGG